MRQARSLVKWTAVAATIAVFWMMAGGGVHGVDLPGQPAGEPRADIITIDTMKTYGPLERPSVVFLHTQHTDALTEVGKDCQACHLTDGERLSLKFNRLADKGPQAVMDAYHLKCISCHTEQAAANKKSGPVECGECHVTRPLTSNRLPMGFDKSLHYRHAKAADNKCEKCHHEYDAKAKKLVYVKGQEGTCRYCHKQKTEENRISMPLAAHMDCIACHRRTAAEKKETGPVDCTGCHAPEKRQMIKTVKNVPRMPRNQPDVVLMHAAQPGENAKNPASEADRMPPVPFNHIGHEKSNDSCRVCHHADLANCNSCHTPTGDKKGKNVTLGQAMHQLKSGQSCVGCHGAQQTDSRCAGCHATMNRTQNQNDASCRACHMTPPAGNFDKADPEAAKKMAALMLESRTPVTGTFPPADIPETVIIKGLSDQYEEVVLPHRKIVNTLVENIKDNNIARYFHLDKGTVCQGCHHNSPVSKKPPRCASCHGKSLDNTDTLKPGIVAAYHRQCMACHETMGIVKPESRDCTACHIKKKDW